MLTYSWLQLNYLMDMLRSLRAAVEEKRSHKEITLKLILKLAAQHILIVAEEVILSAIKLPFCLL